MKRNMELLRNMILLVEDHQHGFAPREMEIDGFTQGQIAYHAYLLVDSGLAEGAESTHMGSSGPEALITHLTWAGHDFADACRNETIWKKATSTVKEKTGSVTFDVLKEVLVSLLKHAVGLG